MPEKYLGRSNIVMVSVWQTFLFIACVAVVSFPRAWKARERRKERKNARGGRGDPSPLSHYFRSFRFRAPSTLSERKQLLRRLFCLGHLHDHTTTYSDFCYVFSVSGTSFRKRPPIRYTAASGQESFCKRPALDADTFYASRGCLLT